MPESPFPGWFRLIRPQDFVWIPLFIALAATSEILDVFVVVPLVALGLVQVLEPKIPALVLDALAGGVDPAETGARLPADRLYRRD